MGGAIDPKIVGTLRCLHLVLVERLKGRQSMLGRLQRILGAIAIVFCLTIYEQDSVGADETVSYRLKWLLNMSTVGDIVAETHGFFKAEGMTVDLKPGGPERDAIRELELGYADFGVASADQVLKAVSKGAPVVVIIQLFQVNPLQWIYFKDQVVINGPQDLAGKRIGITFGKNDEFIMRTILAKAGVGERQVQFYSVRLDYTPFYQHKVDLWPVYINTQGIEIRRKLAAAGEATGFLQPSQLGVNFVANSVVTSMRMLQEKPDLVARFARALLKGWQYALSDKNARVAISAVQQYDRDSTESVVEAQLEETRKLVHPNDDTPIGTIDRAAWQQTEQIMLAHGQITKPVHVERYLRPR